MFIIFIMSQSCKILHLKRITYLGLQIENFTVSFSDGRALCYLLNHYHPALLTKDEIIDETTVTCSMTREGDSDGEIDDCLIYQNLTKSYCSSRFLSVIPSI